MNATLPPICVLRSTSLEARVNLSLEEWLLGRTRPGDWRLLIYRNGPGVVIGRYQNAWRECNLAALRESGGEIHRRITGGGAVWHDAGNLNFCFVAARDSYCVERQFSVVCRALEACGIEPVRTPQNALMAQGLKFSGNAFTLKKSGAIHHGTLLVDSDLDRLNQCLAAPAGAELRDKSVRSIPARVGNLAALRPGLTIEYLATALAAAYRGEPGAGRAPEMEISPGDLDAEFARMTERHAAWVWRLGASPPFDVHSRIGGAVARLAVEEGIIREAAFTNFDNGSHVKQWEALAGMLTGQRFDRQEIVAAASKWRADERPGPAIDDLAGEWMRGLNA